jgi:hypothetical protein
MNNNLLKLKIFLTIAAFLFWPFFVFAYQGTPQTSFPKLANYYTKWVLSESDASELAKWDVLVLDPQTGENSANIFREIRQKNPDIIILARVAAEEINTSRDNTVGFAGGSVRNDLLSQLNDSWYMRDKSGKQLSFWPGTLLMNLTNNSGWNDFLPQFVNSRILSSGLWDGVFYDNVWPNITWFNSGNLDVKNSGQLETAAQIDKDWLAGNQELLSKSQTLFGGKYLIVVNGHDCPQYEPYINGIMMENFPPPWEDSGTWKGAMKTYFDNKNFLTPYIGIINGNTSNTWAPDNYHKMRFYLGSTLLGDAYFSFDYGDQNHQQTWWYDEYQVALGTAVSAPINILDKDDRAFQNGLWRRDFTNGIVVVNSTNQTQNYSLSDEIFSKINGSQDTIVNNGSRVNFVSIAAQDAIILMGDLASRKTPTASVAAAPANNTSSSGANNNSTPAAAPTASASSNKTSENIITNAVFKNGAFYRSFDQNGKQTRNGFFAYDNRYPAGAQIIFADIDNDKINETLVNSNGTITIYRGTKILKTFQPFAGLFKGNISLAIADLNGNGQKELVIGAGAGGGPQVRIFSTDGRLLSGGFFAYDRNFRGGVNVTAIDYNNDGKDEIITGAGTGGGPQVRIFNKDGKVLGGFFAYAQTSRNGVSVAAGRISGNKEKQIITGSGPGSTPSVRIWDKYGKMISQFLAYDATAKSGITVSAADVDNSGQDEILAGSTSY